MRLYQQWLLPWVYKIMCFLMTNRYRLSTCMQHIQVPLFNALILCIRCTLECEYTSYHSQCHLFVKHMHISMWETLCCSLFCFLLFVVHSFCVCFFIVVCGCWCLFAVVYDFIVVHVCLSGFWLFIIVCVC